MMKNYYDILQVSPEAEREIIQAAYRRLAQKYHPDHSSAYSANEEMSEINEAYAALSDPARREEYDRLFTVEHLRKYESTPPYSYQCTPSEFNGHIDLIF